MEISLADIQGNLLAYLLIFFRVFSFFMVIPVIGSQLVPGRVKMAVGIIVAWLLMLQLDTQTTQIAEIGVVHMLMVIEQFVIGIAMGMIVQILFQAFVMAGQIAAMQIGLGYAALTDPQNGVLVPIVSQFYLILVTLIFLAQDGHLLLIKLLAESFVTFPILFSVDNSVDLKQIVDWGLWIFRGGLMVAIPAIFSIFLVNITFGVMTRAAPQLNLFAIGFPMTLMLGIVIIMLAIPTVLPLFEQFFELAITQIGRL